MSRQRSIARCASLAFAFIVYSSAAASHGPAKGYLIITGGDPDFKHFLALAGGANARIVVIPTAAVANPYAEAMLPSYCTPPGPFAAVAHCAALHTTDRKIADSVAFAAPLRTPPVFGSKAAVSGGWPMPTSEPSR